MPIEAGCLAIIIRANFTGNIGKEVRVIELDHWESLKMGEKVWSVVTVSGLIAVRTDDDTDNHEMRKEAFCLGRNLMRIDGGIDDGKLVLSNQLKSAITKINCQHGD